MARLTEIRSGSVGIQLEIPFIPTELLAGFPANSGDFMEDGIDLNETLVQHPATTYLGKVKGNSMTGAGISDGDLVVVDRSLPVQDGVIAVCFLDGEHTIKRIKLESDCCWLIPENEDYEPVRVSQEDEFLIWGVVVYTIKSFAKYVPW